MEKSKAVILSYTPEPSRICASAAKISTTPGTALEIFEKTGVGEAGLEKSGDLVSKVVALGHVTITEHASFNIAFEGVSAFAEQFFIEFRLAAFTIKSRRYVDYSNIGYFMPNFNFPEGMTESDKEKVNSEFCSLSSFLFDEYTYLVEQGIPKEDARFLLPYNFRSYIYCTVNTRELVHMIYSCIHGRGARYHEIKKLGENLLAQAMEIFPDVFKSIAKIESGADSKETDLDLLLKGYKKDPVTKGADELTEIISCSDNPEKIVAKTACIINKGLSTDVAEKIADDDKIVPEIIKAVFKDRRKREFEQVNFTVRINGISLAGLTHLVRHRIQSVIIPSFKEAGKNTDYIVPDTIKAVPALLEKYIAACQKSNEVYEKMRGYGIAEDDLVYLFLSGNTLDVVTTINGRELLHFIKLRTCNRAQWEIRNIAIDLLKKLRGISPLLFGKAGPYCFMYGKCNEGRMSCGESKAINEFFSSF